MATREAVANTVPLSEPPTGSPGSLSLAVPERYWVRVAARLRRYSASLAAAWADGLYLACWPFLSTWMPRVLFVAGLVAGATHWSFISVGDSHLDFFAPAPVFGQDLVLLLVAVTAGALSANLGLVLVLGYALGDFLFGTPPISIPNDGIAPFFVYLHLPRFVSYVLFAMLAVVPTLSSWYSLADILRRIRGQSVFKTILRASLMALAQGIFVYAWVLIAPMVFRVFWAWQHNSSPVTVIYYQAIAVPWLPATAAVMMFVRAWLAPQAYRQKSAVALSAKLLVALRNADLQTALTRRLPVWARAVCHAGLVLLLSSGMIVSWITAAIVAVLLLGVFFATEVILPKVGAWASWCRVMSRVPVGARIAVAGIATFLLAKFVLILPGQGVSKNSDFGAFYAELTSIVVCMFVAMILLAQLPGPAAAVPTKPGRKGGGGRSAVVRRAGVAIAGAVLVFLLFVPDVYAVCADPTCCFGDDLLAILAVLALVLLAAAILGAMALAAAELLEFGAAVAGAEEAGAALAAAEEAAAAAESAAAGADAYAAAAAAAEGAAGAEAAAAAAEGAAAAASAAAEDAAAAAAAAAEAAPGSAAAEAAADAAASAAESAEEASAAAQAAQEGAADVAAGSEPTVVTDSVPTTVSDGTSQAGNVADNTYVGPQSQPTQIVDTGPSSTGDTVIQPAPEDPSELPTQIVNPAKLGK